MFFSYLFWPSFTSDSCLCFFITRCCVCDLLAALYTVEFQKRGLSHGHIIFWVSTDTSKPSPQFINSFISAEIPDPVIDPLAYALVAEHMVHGPCGRYNPKCSCMKDSKCSKNYPKEFNDTTTVNENGFAVYKRPNNQRFVIKGGIKLDNRWIVLHNIELLKKYDAHINTEWCNKSIFIKCLFKYVTKGLDRSKAYLQRITNGEEAPIDGETNM
jgi:hypothetical protein